MGDVISQIEFVEAFSNILIDKWDGDKSVEKAIAILHSAGYKPSSIALYVNEAHSKVIKWLEKTIS